MELTLTTHAEDDLLSGVWKQVHLRKAYVPYRHLMHRAVPFSLDTQATELVTELATHASKCELYRTLARLPYDVVWLDYDYKAKVRKQIALGSRENPFNMDTEPYQMGYLLERISETRWRSVSFVRTMVTEQNLKGFESRYAATHNLQVGDSMLETLPPMFILDTEGSVKGYRTVVRDPALVHAVQYMIDNDNAPCAVGWGLKVPDADVGDWIQPQVRPSDAILNGQTIYGLSPHLVGSATMDLPPDWEMLISGHRPRPHERRDLMVEIMTEAAKEQSGILRFLSAALASITAAPTVLVERKKQGTFRADGRLRNYKVNQIVSIQIPGRRTTGVRNMLALFKGAKRRMARHQVHGFWRTTQAKESPGDRWEWLYSPRYREFRWHIWINDFERGDAALGYVLRKYEVTSS
jgi:hypothetical protein